MSKIKSKNTLLEILVRKELHSHGLRFRLHSKKLPGKPDIILPKHKLAIYVHGCFWHRCRVCNPKTPKGNYQFWQDKFNANIKRDKNNIVSLKQMGWNVIVLWECEIKNDIDQTIKSVLNIIKK